jgi:hypothetical protein
LVRKNQAADFIKEDQVLSKDDVEEKERKHLEEATKALQESLNRAEADLVNNTNDNENALTSVASTWTRNRRL